MSHSSYFSLPKPAGTPWWAVLIIIATTLLAGLIAAIFGGVVALVLVLGLVLLALTVNNFRIGLVVLVLILPFQNTAFLPSTTGFNLTYYFSVITLAVLFFGYRMKWLHAAAFPNYIVWLFLLPLCIAWGLGVTHLNQVPELFILQTGHDAFLSPKKYLAEMLVKPLLFVLMAWMAGCAITNSKKPERWLLLVAVGPVLPAASMLIYLPMMGYDLKFLASPQARYIYANVGLHTTQYGLLFASAFAIQLFLFGSVKGWLKVGLSMCMMVVGAALVLSFSRVGYLAAAIAVVYFLVTQRKLSNYLVVLMGIALVSLLMGDYVLQRVSTGLEDALSSRYAPTTGMSGQELTAGRVYIWSHLLPEILRSPIIGSGLGSTMWSEALRRGAIPASHPHNIYLGMMLDMGLIGFAAVLLFYAKVFALFRRLMNNPALSPLYRSAFMGAYVAFIGFLVSGLGDNRYYPVREQTYFWLMFGIGLGLVSRKPGAESHGNVFAPLTRKHDTIATSIPKAGTNGAQSQ